MVSTNCIEISIWTSLYFSFCLRISAMLKNKQQLFCWTVHLLPGGHTASEKNDFSLARPLRFVLKFFLPDFWQKVEGADCSLQAVLTQCAMGTLLSMILTFTNRRHNRPPVICQPSACLALHTLQLHVFLSLVELSLTVLWSHIQLHFSPRQNTLGNKLRILRT